MRDAGQPEAPSPAQTKKRGNGATREIAKRLRRRIKGQGVTQDPIAGSAEGCGIRGGSNPHSKRSQRNEGPGRPGNSPLASPEGAEVGETRPTTSRRAEEDETSGRPGDSTSARAGRCSQRGDLATHREAAPGRRGFGVTRRIDSRADERCEIRCAPKIPSPAKAGRHSDEATRKNVEKQHWYSECTGQPGFLKPVLLKDAKVGATRRSIAGTA